MYSNSGQVVASTRTAEEEQKPLKSVLNANATPWSPSDLNRAVLSQAWKLSVPSKKKLLILDVNGLLVARYKKIDRSIIPPNAPHEVVAKSYMFKRPYCDNFLTFCLENFHVGVWTSMMEANVVKALDYICQGMQAKFVFVMHQGDCTPTGLRNPQKRTQPLFLKELVKAWSKFPRGQFNESNTLLIDDTPYKALRNPPHTAIFPEAYLYNEADTFLKGPLMEYLTQLRDAVDVREFVRTHPFGMPAIAPGCLHWNVYQKVLETKVTQAENIGSRLYNTIPELPQTQISSLTVGILLAEEQKRLEILSLT